MGAGTVFQLLIVIIKFNKNMNYSPLDEVVSGRTCAKDCRSYAMQKLSLTKNGSG